MQVLSISSPFSQRITSTSLRCFASTEKSCRTKQRTSMEHHPALELLKSIQSNALSPDSPPQFKVVDSASKPSFGSIYFGPLPCFAWGKPHFAMIQSDTNSESVVFAPITSKQPDPLSLAYCLEIPPASLPKLRFGMTAYSKCWALLPIMLRVPLHHLRDKMRLEVRLHEKLTAQARQILKRF